MTSDFEKFQQRFMEAVLGQDDSILKEIKDSSKENRKTLLHVYQHAYGARLEEFLVNDFPLTNTYLGEDTFSSLANRYAAAYPSNTPNARWYGRHFPGFLKTTEETNDHLEIAELAELELALNTAFDAKDTPPLGLETLTALAPEEWPAITFTAHPSVTRLSHQTNAADIWAALSREEKPPETQTAADKNELITWRGEGLARYRLMAYDEAMIWDQAMKGADFAALCEMLGTYGPEEEAALRAAGYLQSWLTSEFLQQPKN